MIIKGHSCDINPFAEVATVKVKRTGTTVRLLGSMEEYHRYYQIDIRQCAYGGHNCKIRSLHMLGRKLLKDEEHASVPHVLVSDLQEVEEKNLGRQEQQPIAARGLAGGINTGEMTAENLRQNPIMAFLRGLNGKKKVGGPKSSKIKLPKHSQVQFFLYKYCMCGGLLSNYFYRFPKP
jgi:hypothetical protein